MSCQLVKQDTHYDIHIHTHAGARARPLKVSVSILQVCRMELDHHGVLTQLTSRHNKKFTIQTLETLLPPVDAHTYTHILHCLVISLDITLPLHPELPITLGLYSEPCIVRSDYYVDISHQDTINIIICASHAKSKLEPI